MKCSRVDKQLLEFIGRNAIAIKKRPDIWKLISLPYSDDDANNDITLANTADELTKQGLSEVEIRSIRRIVRMLVLGTDEWSWHSEYFGHFEYLTCVIRTPDRYWRSMDIALRNYTPKNG